VLQSVRIQNGPLQNKTADAFLLPVFICYKPLKQVWTQREQANKPAMGEPRSELAEQKMRSSFPLPVASPKTGTSSAEAHPWWWPQEYTAEELGIDEYGEDEEEECA